MTNRKRELFHLATTKENTFLVGTVRYEMGGANYFSGTSSARGYYFSVTPETITRHDGYTSREFLMFSGVKAKLKDAARFSPREFAALMVPEELKTRLINHVLAESVLQLATVPA